ncbi:MAG: thiolase family protein [Firmicutes bacterium]|nr:thiolase family protein [Bacillota bacterium]
MSRNVCIIGGGMTVWGAALEASARDMYQEAGKACFEDIPGLSNKDVDGLIVASSFTERISFQTHLAPVVAEYLGIKPKNICARVELLCASGSSAIIMAYGLVKSGIADVIMVVGGEKLYTPQRWEVFYSELGTGDHDWDCVHGLGLPPPLFSMVSQLHMQRYGTTEEQLAMVSVKSRRNAANNPKAQVQKAITLEEALGSPVVAAPLKLSDCCPVTDGAAATIIACEEKARYLTDKPLVYIRGTGQATVNNMSANMPNTTTWEALKIASNQAYNKAGIKPSDIDVAQTHDCFTISEIIEYEDLGFCEKGEGGLFVQEGRSDFGGDVPVNTDGGLLSCGHPFGGTGIRQGIEIMRQLRGDATRQVEGASTGLTHNLSGLISVHTILIYGRDI